MLTATSIQRSLSSRLASRENNGVSVIDLVDAIVTYKGTYEIAGTLPAQDTDNGGRPRHYQQHAYIIVSGLVSVFGSARKVFAQFDHGWLWQRIRDLIVHEFPDQPAMHLPAEPMKRHHWTYFKRRYLIDAANLAAQVEAFEEAAAKTALELGLADPDGTGSFSHPALERCVWADGKVITPLSRMKRGTSDRADPDAQLHRTGTGRAFGNKFVLAGCRGPAVHERVVLGLAHADAGGEAKHAVDCIARIAKRLPGVQAAIYDGAMRGKHAALIGRAAGIHLVRPAIAAKKEDESTERLEKSSRLGSIELTSGEDEGDITLDLYARGGTPGLVDFDERGDGVFTPLDRIRTMRRGAPGASRLYNEYRLPTEVGGGTLTLPVYETADDRAAGFNRLEYLHSIAPGESDHERLYSQRPNIESLNRSLEDSLHINRAHSIGAAGQLSDLIGFSLMTNALAWSQATRTNDRALAA